MENIYLKKKNGNSLDLSKLGFQSIPDFVYMEQTNVVDGKQNMYTIHNYIRFSNGTQIEYGWSTNHKNNGDLIFSSNFVDWPIVILTPYHVKYSIMFDWYQNPDYYNKVNVHTIDSSVETNVIGFTFIAIGRWK